MNVNHGVSGQEVDGHGGPGHKTGAMQVADWRGPGSTGVLVPLGACPQDSQRPF